MRSAALRLAASKQDAKQKPSSAKRGNKRRAEASEPAAKRRVAPYHHGDLRTALLEMAEAILVRDGIQGLTLRAAARAVNVTHAAPMHHFGDLTGLLSELAAIGFRRFTDALRRAVDAAQPEPRARLLAMGRAYVEFAYKNPAIFMLMFRGERLDYNRPALRDGLAAASLMLAEAIHSRLGDGATPASPLTKLGAMAAVWAEVHGFAILLIDGRLDPLLAQLPPGQGVGALLDAALARFRGDDR